MVRVLSSPTGRRFYLSGAKQEDAEVHTISIPCIERHYIRAAVEFENVIDAMNIATLLVEEGAYSSVEVLESHGILVKRKQ